MCKIVRLSDRKYRLVIAGYNSDTIFRDPADAGQIYGRIVAGSTHLLIRHFSLIIDSYNTSVRNNSLPANWPLITQESNVHVAIRYLTLMSNFIGRM
jgi:hypothetical protein